MVHRRQFLAGVAALALVGACSDDDSGDGNGDSGERTSPSDGDTSGQPSDTPDGQVKPTVATTVVDGMNVPWAIVFLPNGDALVSERDTARIVRVSANGRTSVLGKVPDVAPSSGFGEGGLLGLALDPDDAATLYAYHTTSDDNRIVRIGIGGGHLGRPEPILTGIPASTHHNGGSLMFGPDNMLYASTGDAESQERAQDRNNLGGKILRIRPNGNAAPDNPFDNEVWTYGHRNVEGLAFDDDGQLWASEFGDAEFDELNLIERGNNYGWPEVEGVGGDDYTDPVNTWSPAKCSPAGLAVARGNAFLGALRGERLISVPLRGKRTGKPSAWFVGEYGRIRGVVVAPDGALWVTTSNTDGRSEPGPDDDKILRVTL